MIQYACPKCSKDVMFLEIDSHTYKYKIACRHCAFYDWVDKLTELKENDTNGKKD